VPTLLAPRYWGAHLLMVLAVAATVALGLWQLHVWQEGRAAEARDLTTAAPMPLTDVMSGDDPFPGKYLGQPVSFSGTWLGADTIYVADRELDGRRGYWVVTPVLVGDSAMPVVRGWSAEPRSSVPNGSVPNGSVPNGSVPNGRVTVRGWLQASEGAGAPDEDPHDDVIPEMRIASIVEHVDADLYSGYVVAKEPTDGLAAVTPDSIPAVSNVDHLRNLLYTLQWWIFAGLAIYIWLRWCRETWEQSREVEQVASGV
jgi:surfeit locus 1 family protein